MVVISITSSTVTGVSLRMLLDMRVFLRMVSWMVWGWSLSQGNIVLALFKMVPLPTPFTYKNAPQPVNKNLPSSRNSTTSLTSTSPTSTSPNKCSNSKAPNKSFSKSHHPNNNTTSTKPSKPPHLTRSQSILRLFFWPIGKKMMPNPACPLWPIKRSRKTLMMRILGSVRWGKVSVISIRGLRIELFWGIPVKT